MIWRNFGMYGGIVLMGPWLASEGLRVEVVVLADPFAWPDTESQYTAERLGQCRHELKLLVYQRAQLVLKIEPNHSPLADLAARNPIPPGLPRWWEDPILPS